MQNNPRPTVSGPLQEKVMFLLRSRPMCGKDLMKELGIKSPGTIYPVLDDLRNKEMIDFQIETSGPVRKKTYDLTPKGKSYLRESMTNSAKMFCCDPSLYFETVLRDTQQILTIHKHQKVLSTIDYVNLRRYVNGADITYSSDVSDVADQYDVILTYPGLGCLTGREEANRVQYFSTLRNRLRPGGRMLVVEIERTDNLFAMIFFEDIRKMKKQPGISSEELTNLLSSAGFEKIRVETKSGLLYALAGIG